MKQSIEASLGAWSDGPGPLHRKLGDAIRRAIDQGLLAPGERLPAERELANRLAVSRSTVVTAFDALRAEGLLESRQGSGTRVRQRSTRRAIPAAGLPLSPVYRSLIETHDEVISLACAIFPAHPAVAEAMVDVVTADGPKLLTQIGYAAGRSARTAGRPRRDADPRRHPDRARRGLGDHRRPAGGEPGDAAAGPAG